VSPSEKNVLEKFKADFSPQTLRFCEVTANFGTFVFDLCVVVMIYRFVGWQFGGGALIFAVWGMLKEK